MILDLFAGPGGWDEGARPLGLRPVGIEWDDAACRTAAAAGHVRVRADVETLPTEPMVGKVKGLILSPPCTDYSPAGIRAGIEGKSGHLVAQVLRCVGDLRPEWVACEQVPQVEPIWQHYAYVLRSWGYRTWVGVLNAADYGVPQDRERAFLLAHKWRAVGPPEPTHAANPALDLFGPAREPWLGFGAALGVDSPLRHVRGAGMIERHGPRPDREPSRPSFTLTGKCRSWRLVGEGDRPLTIPELSVLQSFPADYPWWGSRSAVAQQVGNAVPPLMAQLVLAAVTGVKVQAVAA